MLWNAEQHTNWLRRTGYLWTICNLLSTTMPTQCMHTLSSPGTFWYLIKQPTTDDARWDQSQEWRMCSVRPPETSNCTAYALRSLAVLMSTVSTWFFWNILPVSLLILCAKTTASNMQCVIVQWRATHSIHSCCTCAFKLIGLWCTNAVQHWCDLMMPIKAIC